MELLDLIEHRVSVRKYRRVDLEPEKLNKVLEAMRRAPSAGNRQKWLFYVAKTPESKARLATVTQFPWVSDAGVVLAVVGTDCGVMTNGHRSDTIDLSIAMSFGMLEATALGLGTCWIAHYKEADARKALELPADYSVAALMTLGYPDEAPAPQPRKPLEEIIRTV